MNRCRYISVLFLFLVPYTLYGQLPEPEWKRLAGRYAELTRELTPDDIVLEKELAYDRYTLEDEYEYGSVARRFRWDTVKARLVEFEELIAHKGAAWAILQNYKTRNGTAALVGTYGRDEYDRVVDSFGVERYQAVPVYALSDTLTPVRYARDGALARILPDAPSAGFAAVDIAGMDGRWLVPERYLFRMDSGVVFKMAIFVGRTDQNIAVLERVGPARWKIRSMNPATTGVHNPPYAQETPTGLFVLQERKPKMYYLVDGTGRIAGYAPWASRFTRGAYIHGVPVNNPDGAVIEYSWTLGTVPRSHMCVRNASSHAKFIYDSAPLYETLVFVIE